MNYEFKTTKDRQALMPLDLAAADAHVAKLRDLPNSTVTGSNVSLDTADMGEVRRLYFELMQTYSCKGNGKRGNLTAKPKATAQHAAFTPLCDYLGISMPDRTTTALTVGFMVDVEAFISTGEEPGGDAEGVEEAKDDASVTGVGTAGTAPIPTTNPDFTTTLSQIPPDVLAALRGIATAPSPRVPTPDDGMESARAERRPAAAVVAEGRRAPPDSLRRAPPTTVDLSSGAQPERGRVKGRWAEQGDGLLVTQGAHSVEDVMGEKSYTKGLQWGERDVDEMQTLYFLRKVAATYPSVLAWVHATDWKNPRNKQEAVVLGSMVDSLGRELGGHGHTLGSITMETMVRRLQSLTLLERENKRNAASISNAWMSVVVQTEGGVMVSATPLAKLDKAHNLLNAGHGGGKKEGKKE